MQNDGEEMHGNVTKIADRGASKEISFPKDTPNWRRKNDYFKHRKIIAEVVLQAKPIKSRQQERQLPSHEAPGGAEIAWGPRWPTEL